MSFKISKYSEMGGSFATQPHIGIPTTQTEAIDMIEDIILPSSLPVGYLNQQGSTLTFNVPESDVYTDFSKSYLRIKGTWNDTTGNGPQMADLCAPVANFPSSLFSDVGFYMNDTTISPNKQGDLWISFVDRLLLNRRGAVGNSNSFGVSANELDSEIGLDMLDTVGQGGRAQANNGTANFGAQKRATTIVADSTGGGGGAANTNTYEYLYQPAIGVWKIKKYIPDRVKLQLDLRISQAGLYAFGGAGAGNQWAFTITTIELILHRLKMHQAVADQNRTIITVDRPWVSPFGQYLYTRNSINLGVSTFDLVSVHKGMRPKFVLVMITDQATTAGNWLSNPYYISEGDIGTVAGANTPKQNYVSYIYLKVNGKQYPIRKGYDPSSIYGHQRDYRALLTSCADGVGLPAMDGTLITYRHYGSNYTIYCFQLTPEEGNSDEFFLTEDTNVELHGTFSVATQAQQIVHTIAYVPAVLNIDSARVCSVSFR